MKRIILLLFFVITFVLPSVAQELDWLIEPTYDYDMVQLDNEGYTIVSKNDKWGYAKPNGELLTGIEYDGVEYFSSGLAGVNKAGKWGFINKGGSLVISHQYKSHYWNSSYLVHGNFLDVVKENGQRVIINTKTRTVSDYEFYYISYFSCGLAHIGKQVYKKDGSWIYQWGYINESFELVIPFQYSDCWAFFKDVAIVSKDGKWGVINRKGKVIIPIEYDYIDGLILNYNENDLIIVQKDGKYGCFDTQGGIILPLVYDEIQSNYGLTELIRIKKNGKWGVVNFKYNTIDTPVSDAINDFYSNLTGAKKMEKWGLINKKGVTVVPFQYDGIENYIQKTDKFITFEKNGKIGVINTRGDIIIDAIYNYITIDQENSTFKVSQKGKKGIVDKKGDILIEIKYDRIYNVENTEEHLVKKERLYSFFNGDWKLVWMNQYEDIKLQGEFILVKRNKKWGVVRRKTGEIVIPIKYSSIRLIDDEDETKRIFHIEKGNKQGYANKQGRIIISPVYYLCSVMFFDGESFFIVKKGENTNYGLLNSKGETIIPLEYENLISFDKKGLSINQKNGKKGAIDRKGEIIIPFVFDDVKTFQNNQTWVKYKDKWGIIRHPFAVQIPKINFTNLRSTLLTDARSLQLQVCVQSSKPLTKAKIYIDGKDYTRRMRGIGIGKDKKNCQKDWKYTLKLSRYGNYEVKVIASNEFGTTTETRTIQVARNIAPTIEIPKGKNYAFVIGINDYDKWNDLKNPVNDCEALINVLSKHYTFEEDNIVTLYDKDATRSNIMGYLSRLSQEMRPEDNLLIYYAGHGYYNKKTDKGYWLPVDAPNSKAYWDFILDSQIKEALCESKSSNIYIIADACYSGSFFDADRESIPPPANMSKFIRTIQKETSFRGFASGGFEPVSDEDVEEPDHSPFSAVLLKILIEWEYLALPASSLENAVLMQLQPRTQQTPEANAIRACDKQKGKRKGQFIFYKKK